jgi:hypothetical protein
MNNIDFEKTQIWAKNLMSAPLPTVPPVDATRAAVKQPSLPPKPVLKKLSAQEKIILATGGALAIGLGAIVITSLSDDEVIEKSAPVPVADLTAPKLDLGVPQPEEKQTEPEPPKLHQAAPREHAPKRETHVSASQVAAVEEHHALLEIPEIPEVATTVGDELTFIEAFNLARREVGPAGLFAWRDTYYSTFTDKEWELVPEDKKAQWLEAAEPIIDPGYENLSEVITTEQVAAPQHVIVAERGSITWTGIDRNGDGQAEILMARITGQSPMVLMDTDGDGILDTRYDYEAATGKTFASVIEPFSMSTSDIEHLEYVPVEPDMGFYNYSGNRQVSDSMQVSIYQESNKYVVSLDSNLDNTIDAITYLTDDQGPVVGLDYDNDGQIEMGYVYDAESQTVNSLEMEPLEEMNFGPPEGMIVSVEDEQQSSNAYQAEGFAFQGTEENGSSDDDETDNFFRPETETQDGDALS